MDVKTKSAIFGMVSIATSLIAAAALLEFYVRLTQADGTNFDIEMWRYAKDLKVVSDIPGAGHEHAPGKTGVYMGVPVTINSAGWRDREHSVEKENGTVRIMMLGDSLTFGWGARPEDITSYRLERLLNAKEKKFEVINTGIGNANTAMEATYFMKKAYVYKPDIVVLNYFINDAEPTPRRTENVFLEHFYSAVFIAGRFDAVIGTVCSREVNNSAGPGCPNRVFSAPLRAHSQEQPPAPRHPPAPPQPVLLLRKLPPAASRN